MIYKPFSQACENNKTPILNCISSVFTEPVTVWEIGSGTGQHACHFADQLPHLTWQPTDRAENIEGILQWVEEANLANLKSPLTLDIQDDPWPVKGIDALFTANTLHIMSWQEVQVFFTRLGIYLNAKAKICIYGPFNYFGAYTSDSNASFDLWLKSRNSLSCIKNFEDILALATSIDCELIADEAMPANNRLLVFNKV